MCTVIFGAKGYLGEYFLTLYPEALTPSIDIADESAVATVLDAHKPEIIINCAGKTGRPNIDWCENHKHETIRSNLTGPLVLLEEAQKRDIYFVQLSSGCIYSGYNNGNGWTEDDPPNFKGSFYSRTKIWADQILKEFDVLLLRLRMPFDGTNHPRNFMNKIAKYDKLIDVQNSLTYLPDFMNVAEKLIEKKATGIYNIVNAGAISPAQVMALYQEIVDPSHRFDVIAEADLPTTAGRSNCSLSIEKLKNEGIKMRGVEEVVREALESMKYAV